MLAIRLLNIKERMREEERNEEIRRKMMNARSHLHRP